MTAYMVLCLFFIPLFKGEIDEEEHGGARQILTDMEKHVKSMNSCNLTTIVLDGDPRIEIVKYAEEAHADYLVVGSHGRSEIKSGTMGSVGDYIFNHTGIPVIVVRRKDLHTRLHVDHKHDK